MRKSTLEKSRRYLALFGSCLGVSTACDRPSYTYSDDVSSSGGTLGVGGSFTSGGFPIGGTSQGGPCALDRSGNASPVLAKQVVSNRLAARAELYAEVTDAEALALKAGGSLLPPPPAPGAAMPLSALSAVLSSALSSALNAPQNSASQDRQELIQRLLDRFSVTRSTWPNPWALRLVEHAGSEHMTPLRIRLKDEAWIVRIEDGSPVVVDVNNGPISIQEAVRDLERVAAVYYVYDDRVPIGDPVAKCETGKREFALGNEAMVAEFSLETADILARLNSDIEDLTGLFNLVRRCSTVAPSMGTFHTATVCQAWKFFDPSTEYSAYQWSLSNPVELYRPTTQNLASLIDALKNDRFELDPFLAAPQSSDGGMGGAAQLGDGGQAQGGAAPGGAP